MPDGGPSPDAEETVRLIRESAEALGVRSGDLSRIRALRDRDPGYDRAIWSTMCELGWIGMRRPERTGAPAFGMVAFCALAEELGAGLVPEPFIAAATAASLLPSPYADEIAAGSRVPALAWQGEVGSLDPAPVSFRDGRIGGKAVFVPFAAACDWFIVPVVDRVAIVERAAAGVLVEQRRLQDGTNAGDVTFEAARAETVRGDVDQALDAATLATAAYLLGLMERAFAITLDYLRERRQFGGPIGRFQVLRHGAVDLSVQIALTRASVAEAAGAFDRVPDRARRRVAVSRAKARASEAALRVTRQAIQLHGAPGYTDEADPGLFLRRAMVAAAQHGGAAVHRRRFLDLSRGARRD